MDRRAVLAFVLFFFFSAGFHPSYCALLGAMPWRVYEWYVEHYHSIRMLQQLQTRVSR